MPRLSVVDPATATGKAKELFDGPLKGKHINIYKGIANSPAALAALMNFGGALAGGMLRAKEREIIALALAEANDCGYCVAAHTRVALMNGLTEEQTVAARRGKPSDPKHAALAKFTLALREKHGHVSDADLQAMRAAGYGDGHIVEVLAVYAQNIFTNYLIHVNETEIDFPAPPALT